MHVVNSLFGGGNWNAAHITIMVDNVSTTNLNHTSLDNTNNRHLEYSDPPPKSTNHKTMQELLSKELERQLPYHWKVLKQRTQLLRLKLFL